MAMVNPVQGAADQFSGGMKLIKPPEPLPVPVTRSFLFEIINTKTNMVVESFALVVPPQAVSIREPQRVSISKTFGNVFVDDYGPDNPQIMIKGFSGTAHPFPTYRPINAAVATQSAYLMKTEAEADSKAAAIGYTHRDAFFEFRNSIIRYKYNYKENYGDMKLRVYDLYDMQSYDCILMEFSCDRDANKPLYYPYSIALLVYNMPDVTFNAQPEIIELGGVVDTIISGIETGLNYINAAFSFVQGVSGVVSTISNTMNLLAAQATSLVDQAGSLARMPLQSVKSLIESVGKFSTVVDAAYTQSRLTKQAYQNAREMIQDLWRQTMKLYCQAITQGQQTSRTEFIHIDNGVQVDNSSNSTSATANARAADPQSFTFTGFSVYTVKGQDTLQAIAQSTLGDSNLWPYIAKINNIINNTELHQRSQIFIPAKSASNKDAFIVSEHSDRDPYGTDIRLDDNGNILISGNDFVLISGASNVYQWINMMLGTPRGSVLKHTVLGLSAAIGGAGDSMAYGYLASSIRITLQQDPRIKSVTNIIAAIDGDVMRINMNIGLVGFDQTLPVSVTL